MATPIWLQKIDRSRYKSREAIDGLTMWIPYLIARLPRKERALLVKRMSQGVTPRAYVEQHGGPKIEEW